MTYKYYRTEKPFILKNPLLENIVYYINEGYDVVYVEKVGGVTGVRLQDLSGYTIGTIKTVLAAVNNYSDGFIIVFKSEKKEEEDDD